METQVLIIGGGATGTGLARDLELRGVQCVVVERCDINSGASGANHGLLHSGARYVASDPAAARECASESRLLKRLAAHCIEDTGGLFVAVPGDDEKYIADFPALCRASGITATPLSPRDALEMEPALNDGIIAAYRVEDASINPFRLSVDNMAHAETLGAKLIDHAEVVGMERSGRRIETVRLRKLHGGEEITVRAGQVVNASGAWTGATAALASVEIDVICSKGSLLVTQSRVADCVLNRLRPPSDGDILVPGGPVSIFGTTSIRTNGPGSFHPSCPEVDFLVAEAAKMAPDMVDARYIRAYAGIRGLLGSSGALDDRSLSRSFILLDHEADGLDNFVTVFGGKLTTFRIMAERVSDLVCERLGVTAPCVTAELPLPALAESGWVDVSTELRGWLRRNDPNDTILCECEMIPMSVVDRITDRLIAEGRVLDFGSIGTRSRFGKGACQGAFCALRLCGRLYDREIFHSGEGPTLLKDFLDKRWAGLRPVLWGRQMVQEQLQEAIHCGLLGIEHNE